LTNLLSERRAARGNCEGNPGDEKRGLDRLGKREGHLFDIQLLSLDREEWRRNRTRAMMTSAHPERKRTEKKNRSIEPGEEVV